MMYYKRGMDRSVTAALLSSFWPYFNYFFVVPVNKFIKLRRLWLGQKPISCPKTSQ